MKEGYKICPYCANEIKEGAKKCQHCHERLEENQKFGLKKKCPFCLNEIDIIVNTCPFCGELLDREITQKISIKKSPKKEAGEKVENRWPSNRLGRLKFFLYSIGFNILSILLMAICGENLIQAIFLINILIHIYLLSKRFHDCGYSGRYSLFCIIFYPLITIMYFVKGDEGDNKYGPAPHGN